MLTLIPFPWRRLTARSHMEHRLDEQGELVLRGASDTEPPFSSATVRDGAGGFVKRSLAQLGYVWTRATSGEGWTLRSSGDPITVARTSTLWSDLVRAITEPLGLDERIVLITIACESFGAVPDAKGLVYAPRTENGYPRRTGEHDPGDPARDAEDWRLSGGMHSSHGLMQTLIATAVAARPDLFAGRDPKQYRKVLWIPANSIACGVAHLKHFSPEVLADPLAVRFAYGAGSVRPAENVWGAFLYDELVPLMWVSFWNDDASVRAGSNAIARGWPPAPQPGAFAWAAFTPDPSPLGLPPLPPPAVSPLVPRVSSVGPSLLLGSVMVIFGAILARGAHR